MGNEQRNVQQYLVCLVDILGQSSLFKKWSELPKEGEPEPDYVEGFEKTVGTVEMVRNVFNEIVPRLGADPDLAATLDEPQRQEFLQFMERRLKIDQFSDTLVLYAPLADTNGVNLVPVGQVVLAIAGMMTFSLSMGIPLRGAVTVGTGIILDQGDFYGPALAEVHHLESSCAGYPRIIISPEMIKMLKVFANHPPTSKLEALNVQLAVDLLRIVAQDEDGMLILDYLGQEYKNQLREDWRRVHPREMMEQAAQYIESQRLLFRSKQDQKLAIRYSWLARYFESRKGLWL